jgi:hypothetical protein
MHRTPGSSTESVRGHEATQRQLVPDLIPSRLVVRESRCGTLWSVAQFWKDRAEPLVCGEE